MVSSVVSGLTITVLDLLGFSLEMPMPSPDLSPPSPLSPAKTAFRRLDAIGRYHRARWVESNGMNILDRNFSAEAERLRRQDARKRRR